MKLTYEAPTLESYGKVRALTSSFKCSVDDDLGLAAANHAANGAEFDEFKARFDAGDPDCYLAGN